GHPDLMPTLGSAPTTATSGTTVAVEWLVTNQGSAATLGAWTDRVYLSTDTTFDPSDRLLGERSQTGPLAASDSYAAHLDVPLPLDVSGHQYLLVRTDAAGQVTEPGGENNNLVTAALDIALAPYADLAVSNVTAP